MVCKVIQRNVRVSPRKAKLVCDLIRNKPIKQALVILQHNSKKSSKIIKKLLESAIANATNNHAMNAEKLYVYNIFANQGPTWKRTMPRARGSADMIFKRTTHIEIHLSDDPNERYLYLQNLKSRSSNKTDKKIKKVITKEVKKEKPKMVNGISTDQKHTVVTMHELDNYDYDKRLKDWRKKAGYNENPHTCFKCKEDACYTSILLENKKHICYTCWIKKPDGVETTHMKEVKKAPVKKVKKEKPKMVNGISTDQKHIVVTTAEFDEYNYQKRLKDWRKKAGYNENPHTCFKCKEGDCHTSILLENKKHICYTCWIKKPDTTSSKGKK